MKFDLHGTVTVRLIDADQKDARTLERQLGPIRKPDDSAAADITIRFVDRIACGSRLRYLGLRDGGFTDDAFLVLRSRHKARARTLIPMDRIGGSCEIVCEHGIPAVPLLPAIVNLTAAAKGVLALHAAAFEWHGTGIVVTGWSKGGKTESLLAFVKEGARYVADEWCYVMPGGQRIFGIPEPVRLWHWQLSQIPGLRQRVPLGDRLTMKALGLPAAFQNMLSQSWQRTRFGRMIERLSYLTEQHRNTLVAPEKLFGQPVAESEGRFDRLVFILSAEDSTTFAEPMSPQEAAERMSNSLKFERLPLEQYYRMFRYAFPGVSNPIMERIDETEHRLLMEAFKDKPTLRVEHPYPVDFADLFECMSSFLD